MAILRAGSLVGRASLLHSEGREFESLPVHTLTSSAPLKFGEETKEVRSLFWVYEGLVFLDKPPS